MDPKTLEQVKAGMAILDPELEYYSITRTANEQGQVTAATQTEFAEWGDSECRTEIRIPSLVKPEAFINLWTRLKETYWIVKYHEEWFAFFLLGGHALVEENIAKRMMPSLFLPKPSVPIPCGGFSSEEHLLSTALNRAPTPKLRGNVMKRDGRKCRICGRAPSNHTDLELHVHHVHPWGDRGPTIKENLITLCQTCHKGLDPHEDHSLFQYISSEQDAESFATSVQRYREIAFSSYVSVLVAPTPGPKRSRTRPA